MNDLKISAIVTVCNEDKRLDECLQKLKSCDELVVVNLSSTDNSHTIAQKYATKIIDHAPVSPVEKILAEVSPTLKNNWILHIDPDEIIDERIIHEAKIIINNYHDAAAIAVPWIFYFKNEKLNYTVWGGKKIKKVFYNKKKIAFVDRVHRGHLIISGSVIILETKYFIKHYWVDSYKQLVDKHLRYIKDEGKSRYENGEKYSYCKKIKKSLFALKQNLILEKGILGGFRGIFLSFFYSWYIWQSNNSLKKYERKIK